MAGSGDAEYQKIVDKRNGWFIRPFQQAGAAIQSAGKAAVDGLSDLLGDGTKDRASVDASRFASLVRGGKFDQIEQEFGLRYAEQLRTYCEENGLLGSEATAGENEYTKRYNEVKNPEIVEKSSSFSYTNPPKNPTTTQGSTTTSPIAETQTGTAFDYSDPAGKSSGGKVVLSNQKPEGDEYYRDDIFSAQACLGWKGIKTEMNGKYDEKMKEAVRAFQKKSGLEETGLIDEATAAALEFQRASEKDLYGNKAGTNVRK